MTSYLLDTSVVSILDASRGLLSPALQAWFVVREPRMHISSATVYEAVQGIERQSLAGNYERAAALSRWLDDITATYNDRIIPLDTGLARAAGRLSAGALARGTHPGVADVIIAATAQVHGLLLLTRNVKHFVPLGIDVADPTVGLPR